MTVAAYPLEGLCDICGTQLLPEEVETCDVCYDEAATLASSDDRYRGTIYYDYDELEI